MDILLNGVWRYQHFSLNEGKEIPWSSLQWIIANYEQLREITIPSCQRRGKVNKKNPTYNVFYLKLPDIPYRPESHEYSIEFNGLNYHGYAWINGELIGEITGGSFRNRIIFPPELLSIKDDNYLAVQVLPYCIDKDLPFQKHSWEDCHGIFRKVELLLLERTRVKKIKIKTVLSSKNPISAIINVDMIIKNPQEFFERCYAFQNDPQISYEIFYLGRYFQREAQADPVLIQTGTVDVSPTNIEALHHVDHDMTSLKDYFSDALDPDEIIEGSIDLATFFSDTFNNRWQRQREIDKTVEKQIEKEIENYKLEKTIRIEMRNPILWTPEEPNLYLLKIHLHGIDQDKIVRFGIRKISTKGNQILLNHKIFRLKGICYPTRFLSTKYYSIDERRKDLIAIKNLGFNAIRLMQGALNSEFLKLTDEEGLVVVQDFVLNSHWLPKTKFAYNKIAHILQKFILRDINHPSLIIWSLGNNLTLGSLRVKKILSVCLQLTRKWDETRLITYSSPDDIINPLNNLIDLNCIELQIPNYWGILKHLPLLLNIIHFNHGKAPILISKIGFEGTTRKRKNTNAELNQQLAIQKTLPVISNYSPISGMFLYHYQDFLKTPHSSRSSDSTDSFGIIDNDGNSRKVVKWLPQINKKIKYVSNTNLFTRLIQSFLIIYEITWGRIKKFFML